MSKVPSFPGDDVQSFVVLRKAPTPADEQFGATVAPKISQPIADHELNVAATRVLFNGPDGTAALIPGNASTCFVSDTNLLGTVTSCTPSGWAATHAGFGIVGTIKGTTLIQGVAPDGVTSVQITFAGGAAEALPLNGNNAYSRVLASQPEGMTYLTNGRVVRQTVLRAGTVRAYE